MADFLRTRGLTKAFRGLTANQDIDFSVQAGEIRCVIGPNGAGKTTFISMISGHLRPTAGTIWFRERDITGLPAYRVARLGILRKFQTPSLFLQLTAFENIELAVLAAPVPARQRRRRILDALELVRLGEVAGQPAATLSHGQRQWLEIGMLLASQAQLLLLDEPTAGMTAEETHSTGELLRRLVHELRLASVIIEHDINFIRDLQAPVTVLHLGRVLVEGSFSQIEQNPQVRAVYLGNA